ncbi:MAG: 3D domain-containing protein [Cocleimonas sp.]|nr:3D domain-containing protein [Cocleimonas sp.]
MNLLSAKKSLLVILLIVISFTANTSFSSPNRNYNNNSINSETRGSVAKIQKALRTIKVVRSKHSMIRKVRFAKQTKSVKRVNKLKVIATAYTSHAAQTDSTPNIAAWGDKLRPGMKVIAVSRDLLKIYGLKHGSKVRIKGLSGEYLVLDKMNKRWRKRIDIYMGKNRRKAFKWGRRDVELRWSI